MAHGRRPWTSVQFGLLAVAVESEKQGERREVGWRKELRGRDVECCHGSGIAPEGDYVPMLNIPVVCLSIPYSRTSPILRCVKAEKNSLC